MKLSKNLLLSTEQSDGLSSHRNLKRTSRLGGAQGNNAGKGMNSFLIVSSY